MQIPQFLKGSQKNILGEIFRILSTINHLIDKIKDAPGVIFMDLPASVQISRSGSENDFGLFAFQAALKGKGFSLAEPSKKMTHERKSCKKL